MAAAPMPPAPDPTPAPAENRFKIGGPIFTAILFSPARADAKVFESDRKVKTKKLASVRVEVCKSGGYLHGNVNARQEPGESKPRVYFNFKGTQFESSFTCEDPAIAKELDDAKRSIEAMYLTWRKENPAARVSTTPADAVILDDVTL